MQDGQALDPAERFLSYQELLAGDNEQDVIDGTLQDILVPDGFDADGNQLFRTIPVNPSMSVAGANASTTFFSRFDAGGSHEGYLTDAEMKLLAEWLDVGAQYYNNPFDAPIN